MARLIIGHTTDTSTKLWVRGHERYPFAFVSLEAVDGDGSRERVLELEERHFYTGVVDFIRLEPDSEYRCRVTFGTHAKEPRHSRVEFGHCDGRLRTFPPDDGGKAFSFLLCSCNQHGLGVLQRPGPAYRRLLGVAEDEDCAFMIHAGDQIYYDVPNLFKKPSIPEYREKYLDAWGDSRPTRKLLTRLPHYMILDDHEMVNNFANDMDASRHGSTPEVIREQSLKVYREFVHIRQPQRFGDPSLYYEFSHGPTQFFVLDTRTERYAEEHAGDKAQIIGQGQMKAFLAWIKKHKAAVKLVVTSVPFLGQVRHSDEKWSGANFRHQRERILGQILRHDEGGTVFLTGDMHCSYHATMEVESAARRVTVHELMSSPINQIGKRQYDDFEPDATFDSAGGGFTYRFRLRRREFFGDHSNAMLVGVRDGEVSYRVFRTKSDKKEGIRGTFDPAVG